VAGLPQPSSQYNSSLPLFTYSNSSYNRNCSFYVPGHKALLSPETSKVAITPPSIEAPGIDALPYILLPLAGPEELDLEVCQIFLLTPMNIKRSLLDRIKRNYPRYYSFSRLPKHGSQTRHRA
jgi:hypothetical protein